MSQSNNFEKWLFKYFVTDTPELDFSQVIDLEEDVEERQRRIDQIPQERRVEVLETTVLDTPCRYIVDENQDCIDNFDLTYLTSPNVATQSVSAAITNPGPGYSRDVKYMSGQGNQSVTDYSRDEQYSQGGCGMRSANHLTKHCGTGRISKPPPLFIVSRDSVRTFKNFNIQGTYYLLDIPPPVSDSNVEHWLRRLFNEVIEYFRNNSTIDVRPGDYVGLQLSNTCFVEKPVFVGLRRMDQLDADVIFEKILSIFDSNKDFFVNGKMEVEFNHIQMPHGSGRIKKQLGQTNESFIQGVPSFIKYANNRGLFPNDEFCLPYAIILGRAALDRNTSNFRRYKRRIKKLREAALQLCRDAGVHIHQGGCSIEEVKRFQAILPTYQIVVFQSLEPKHTPYTDPDYYQKDRKINILLSNGHYTAMRTLQACLASEYVCPDCQTRARSRKSHKKCVYTCPCCLSRPPCNPIPNEKMIYCEDCCRSFRGRSCFNNHDNVQGRELFSVCQRVKNCPACKTGYFVDGNDPHVCGFFYCVTCEEKRPDNHECYIKTYETKRDDESNVLYVTYDFETQQNTLLDPDQPGKYKHLPNLCVVQTYCHTCQVDPDNPSTCVDCGPNQRIFFSKDCVHDLLSYIVDKVTERKPVEEEEEVEEEGPRRKRRKRVGVKKFTKVVAIAHNMGGFDGQFILNYILQNGGRFPTPKMIINGTKIIQMCLDYNVVFLDSMNYFHTALSKLPEMFGFEGSKGHYPHLFNTPENARYVGPLPGKQYYSPESMSIKGRVEFDVWYKSHPSDYVFDNDKELLTYCIQDVTILRKACMKFASEFWNVNGIDPFLDACTIAGACNKVFRSNYLKPDTIGVVPTNGYRYRDNQSKIALKWLTLIELRQGIEIQHSARSREKYITGVGKVDGYHGPSNTIFEFMGCFYHGCESCYPNQYLWKNYKQVGHDGDDDTVPVYENPHRPSNEDDERNQTMFMRRENTERRCELIRERGYNLVVMKECEFRRQLKQEPNINALLREQPILSNEPLKPRDAFYGGRTNAIKLYFKSDGITKMYYYDICSLYPFINKTAKCPIKHPIVHIGDVCNTLSWQGMDGLMKVTVAPPRKLYNPVLPSRMHSKLMFFLCNTCAKTCKKCRCNHSAEERSITGTWVIDEVKLALTRGYEIVKIHEIWEYEVTQYDPITKEGGVFVGYINRFLKIKAEASGWPESCNTDEKKDAYIAEFYEREGILLNKDEIRRNPPLRQMAKDQLNSFWGRFGLRPDQMRNIIVKCYDELVMTMLDPKLEMESIIPVNDESLLLGYREKEEHRLPNNSVNVVIAAFTTAYARMELYKYLDMLGPERIYYFDTDSIFFTAKPGDPMPEVGPFLGQMTDELVKFGSGTYITEYVSGGPKNYAFKAYTPSTGKTHTVVKVKGITLNYEIADIVNFDLIKKFVLQSVSEKVSKQGEEEEEEKKNSVEVGLHSIRRTNTGEVYSTRATKTYRVNYTKRQTTDSYDTLPYGY